jgi:hypothetical protein
VQCGNLRVHVAIRLLLLLLTPLALLRRDVRYET